VKTEVAMMNEKKPKATRVINEEDDEEDKEDDECQG